MATDGEIGVDDEDLLLGVRNGMDEGVVNDARRGGGVSIHDADECVAGGGVVIGRQI